MRHLRSTTATLAVAALVVAIAATGCKRSLAPKVDEVWDEHPAGGETEALASLAPSWGAPTRAVLDSGLITFWLHEADGPATHVRLLLPVSDVDELRSAAVVSVLQAHLLTALAGRAGNHGMVVDGRSTPDRIELVLHASVTQTAPALGVLANVLGARAPTTGLGAARAQVTAQLGDVPTSDEQATAELAAALLGRSADNQRALRSEVEGLSDDALLEAWEALVDPRRAVLVVHSGDEASVQRPALRNLADRWRGLGRRPVPPTAIGRLRGTVAPPTSPGHLLAEPATPLRVLAGPPGHPVLMLGRVVPTTSAADRSLARLAQRILQEELDARLVIHGDYGLFMLRVPLSGRDPELDASAAIDALSTFAATRQPQQRLFQAAQLWLGARVVQASLDGEDWTALWSEAIDLASSDDAIAGALARDATAMLEPDPQVLQAWLKRWLDPRSGEPGWQWSVAGASERETRRLVRITPVDESP